MKFWEFCLKYNVTKEERREIWWMLSLYRLKKMMEHDSLAE